MYIYKKSSCDLISPPSTPACTTGGYISSCTWLCNLIKLVIAH